MKVLRESTVLENIDAAISAKHLPSIIRIDLEEGEFFNLIRELLKGESILLNQSGSVANTFQNPEITYRDISYKKGKWKGSYLVYKGVCVQCCYGENE